jgi:transposase
MLTTLTKSVFVYREPVDMRMSYNGLYALAKAENVFAGHIFLFIGKDRKRAKALFWDGTGLNIWQKRLEKGLFADVFKRERITSTELKLFFEGSKQVVRELSPADQTHRFRRKDPENSDE